MIRRTVYALAGFLMMVPPQVSATEEATRADEGNEVRLNDIFGLLDTRTVVTASKRPQEIWKSPATISVITSDDIQHYGYRTVFDALKSVVGIIPADDRFLTFTGVRGLLEPGTYNSRILWLIDGHTINDSYFSWGFPNRAFGVNMDSIDRIEVVRGPASVLYGNSAFLGVVNVVTKTGAQMNGARASAETGGYAFARGGHEIANENHPLSQAGGTVSYGKRYSNGGDMFFSVEKFHDYGQMLRISHTNIDSAGYGNGPDSGIAEQNDYTDALNALAKYKWTDWSFESNFSERKKGYPTGQFGALLGDDRNRNLIRKYFFEGKNDHAWTDSFSTMARLYYDYHELDAYWYYGIEPLDKQYVASHWGGTELQFTHKIDRNTLLGGFEYQLHHAQQIEDYPSFTIAGDDPYYKNSKYSFFNYAGYVQDDFNVLENLILDVGERVEKNQNYGTVPVSRVALINRPVPATTLKLQYGDAFKNPLLHDYFYVGASGPQADIERLRRERIRTVELSWAQDITSSTKGKLTFYTNQIEDPVRYNSTTDSYYNGPKIDARGVEGEFSYYVGKLLNGYVNGNYQDTWYHLTGETLVNSPQTTFKAGLVVYTLPKDRLNIGLEGQYTSWADYQDDANRPEIDFAQKPFTVVNLTVTSRELFWGVDVSGSIYNLLNKYYTYPPGKGLNDPVAADGFNYRLMLSRKF